MASTRTSVLAVLIAGMMVLSGCSALGGDATPTSDPGADATPTPTATEEPTATPTDDGDGGDDPGATPTDDGGDGDDSPTETPTDDGGDGDGSAGSLADPESDVLGWEEVNGTGLWYNESIVVDRSDGLNETELDRVVARGMARVEEVRRLEFRSAVPVEVVSREEFRNDTATRFANATETDRLHQNVKWEAMLMVGESTDAVGVQERTQGATVGGFYSPQEDRIVIVSENATSPKINEITLSQELFHALQGQVFDAFNSSWYPGETEEEHNAADGIIEGDGNFVDRLYQQRCETDWNCLEPESQPGGSSSDIHFGQYLVTFQPYSDGPKFVRDLYRSGGWEAVNAVYDDPPASTEQVIHPEKYGEDEPAEMSFEDRSSDEWEVLDLPNGSDYATFGEGGLATMLFYPFYDSGRTESPVLGIRQFFNVTAGGSVSSFDPIDYANEFTAGWDGDRLYPYVTDDSAETNETGYVWKTVWDSEADAGEFVDGYTQLLDYYDAEAVDGAEDVYRLPESSPYADAISVIRSGDTVTIVNAPTVDELSEVRAGAGP